MTYLQLKIPPLLLVFIFAIMMWFSEPYLPKTNLDLSLLTFLFIVFLLLGSFIIVLGAIAFRRAHTTVNPTKPESSSALVKINIYRFTRNPMYLGMVFILFGWTCILDSPATILFILCFMLYMHYFQIKPEEKVLNDLFGDEYIQYCNKVRRWL